MTRRDILSIAAEYRALLRSLGIEAQQMPDPAYLIDCTQTEDRELLLRHVLWTCEHIPTQIDTLGGHKRCTRWVGLIQGALISYGIVTIADKRKRLEEFWGETPHRE